MPETIWNGVEQMSRIKDLQKRVHKILKDNMDDDHAHKGADYAREVLKDLGITNEDETDIICSAIWHHDSKAEIDSPMDEVLKDADVIHHSLGDPTKEVKEHEKVRYEQLCREFGF